MPLLRQSLIAALLTSTLTMWAQNPVPETAPYVSSPRRALVAPELPEMDETWVANSLAWVNVILDRFPPSVDEAPARRPALQRLDDIFHMQSAPDRPAVQAFLRQRIDTALREMERRDGDTTPRIWKLYNAGFVVRSGGVTVAFDLIPKVWKTDCALSDEELNRLIAQVDVLFVSHEHQDHASQQLAERFLAEGKTVLVPTGLWSDQPLAAKLTYPRRDANTSFTLLDGKRTITVVAYPGHQTRVLNNVYYVQLPDGFGVVHTGDQSLPPSQSTDRAWLDHIGQHHVVDALLVDCWYDNIYDLIEATKPLVVIPGHENELSHTIDHREDYAQTYERLDRSSRPYVVMTWGESIRINSAKLKGRHRSPANAAR